MFRFLCALLLAALVSACGPRMVTSDVTRFHSLPATGQAAGQTFTILPRANQVGSLEFQTYADLVAGRLAAQGFRPMPPDAGTADYVVFVDYGVATGPVEVRSSPVYGSVGFGYGYGYWPHRFGFAGTMPFYHEPIVGYDTYSVTKYTRWVEIEMLRGPAYRDQKVEKVFEGRAVSEGAGRSLPAVMPYLVTALFNNFPGPSGRTVEVSLPVAEGG